MGFLARLRPGGVASAADPGEKVATPAEVERRKSLAEVSYDKSFLTRLTPVIACGAGL